MSRRYKIGKCYFEPSDNEFILVLDYLENDNYKVYSYLTENVEEYGLDCLDGVSLISGKYLRENIEHCKNCSALKRYNQCR